MCTYLMLVIYFVFQCGGNKCRCTQGFFSVGILPWNSRWVQWFPLSVEHPVTYRRATSSSEKHQYLPEYTEASKSKNPSYPLACFSVLVPVVIPPSHQLYLIFIYDFFFLNISFSEWVHHREDFFTANMLHSSCWSTAGLQSKVYIPGLQGGMLPSGALD